MLVPSVAAASENRAETKLKGSFTGGSFRKGVAVLVGVFFRVVFGGGGGGGFPLENDRKGEGGGEAWGGVGTGNGTGTSFVETTL